MRIAKAGRTGSYCGRSGLPIPESFEIPTCLSCGAEWMGTEETDALDEHFMRLMQFEAIEQARQRERGG